MACPSSACGWRGFTLPTLRSECLMNGSSFHPSFSVASFRLRSRKLVESYTSGFAAGVSSSNFHLGFAAVTGSSFSVSLMVQVFILPFPACPSSACGWRGFTFPTLRSECFMNGSSFHPSLSVPSFRLRSRESGSATSFRLRGRNFLFQTSLPASQLGVPRR